MNGKSKWQTAKSVGKVIIWVSSILGIVSFFLQVSGILDLWSLLILPISTLLIMNIPIYYVILLAIGCVVSYFTIKLMYLGVRRLARRMAMRKSILDLNYGRRIATLCQTPRTADFLRQQYDNWESQSHVLVIGGLSFDDYLKRLDNEGFLEYSNGKWQSTRKALEYIAKYHGD